ncbi:hypothetical protein LAT59_00985 [Candidatus Gracilibacteria bacterium]|nr:hypothetical protein [Candidatus Gracilibacteria bacterium]
MNFGMLKHMVDNLITAYTCPFCGSKNISEQNIDIIGAAGNTVNIDMECPSCRKHFMAKTEVIQMNAGKLNADALKKLQHSLQAIKEQLGGNLNVEKEMKDFLGKNPESSLDDEAIVSFQRELKTKKGLKVEDLFSEES